MKISVITPCLNSRKYIEHSIQSVRDQHFFDLEHIIVDGGSVDGTVDILKKYPHLKWISEPDDGQSDAMNKGFNLSTGDIIVYLNADDYFLPKAFETVIRQFEGGAVFVVGNVLILYEGKPSRLNDPKTDLEDMLKWWEKDSFCCNPVGYFYRREVQEKIGGFNMCNHFSMDYEFLLESAHNFKLTKIDATLGVYRRFKGTKTYDSIANFNHVFQHECANRFVKLFDENFIKSHKKFRNRHVKNAIEDKYIVAIIENIKRSHYRNAIHTLFKLFLYSPVRIFYRFGRFMRKYLLKCFAK
jgi:glycosyltransferase involved in cell wall biosynthesis